MMEQKSSLDQTSSESFFFFNPRTPCGVRLNIESSSEEEEEEEVSIHALLAECDSPFPTCRHSPPVSIHALLAECDRQTRGKPWQNPSFNPRTPCGVRRLAPVHDRWGVRFNPRTPCGVRQVIDGVIWDFKEFVSIHALLAECDRGRSWTFDSGTGFNPRTPCGVRPSKRIIRRGKDSGFQSTHSLRSATQYRCRPGDPFPVSIHALLAECDGCSRRLGWCNMCFNPRTPCGVRPTFNTTIKKLNSFQSTHSLRSATLQTGGGVRPLVVSIHALLAECDFS